MRHRDQVAKATSAILGAKRRTWKAAQIESRLPRSKTPWRNRLHGAVPPFWAFHGL